MHILCNKDRYPTSGSEQYRLIHHEFAGLAGVERNIAASSDYTISDQLTDYLVPESVYRLAIKGNDPSPSFPVQYCRTMVIQTATDGNLDHADPLFTSFVTVSIPKDLVNGSYQTQKTLRALVENQQILFKMIPQAKWPYDNEAAMLTIDIFDSFSIGETDNRTIDDASGFYPNPHLVGHLEAVAPTLDDGEPDTELSTLFLIPNKAPVKVSVRCLNQPWTFDSRH